MGSRKKWTHRTATPYRCFSDSDDRFLRPRSGTGRRYEELWFELRKGWLRHPIPGVGWGGVGGIAHLEAVKLMPFLGPLTPRRANRAFNDLRHVVANRYFDAIAPIGLLSCGHLAVVYRTFSSYNASRHFPNCNRRSAYNALPLFPTETRHAVATLKSPHGGLYSAFVILTLLSRPAASVIYYNLIARIVTEIYAEISGGRSYPIISRFRRPNPEKRASECFIGD